MVQPKITGSISLQKPYVSLNPVSANMVVEFRSGGEEYSNFSNHLNQALSLVQKEINDGPLEVNWDGEDLGGYHYRMQLNLQGEKRFIQAFVCELKSVLKKQDVFNEINIDTLEVDALSRIASPISEIQTSKCPNCSQIVSEIHKFCPSCALPLKKM